MLLGNKKRIYMYYTFKIGSRPKLSDITIRDVPITKARKLTTIAVIDDQEFGYLEPLRSHGYVLKDLGDITDIEAVAAYDIAICDIKGVGSAFRSKYEGAHVISEIRNQFPDKYIIAFSGGQFDPSYKKFFDKCDRSIKKDADMDEWCTILDETVALLGNPISRWSRARSVLIQSGVDLYDVMNLEIEYIKAIQKKSPDDLQKAFSSVSASNNRDLLSDVGAGLGVFLGKLIANI
jgi:hypothetical protein